MFEKFINRSIGNGATTSFWYDPWHPWGVLIKRNPELKRKLNIPLDAKVSEYTQGGQWCLPFGRGWDNQVAQFFSVCLNIPISQREDRWVWRPASSFSIQSAVTALSPNPTPIPWAKFV